MLLQKRSLRSARAFFGFNGLLWLGREDPACVGGFYFRVMLSLPKHNRNDVFIKPQRVLSIKVDCFNRSNGSAFWWPLNSAHEYRSLMSELAGTCPFGRIWFSRRYRSIRMART